MSPSGGSATIVPASDYVSTFRGEGVGPDLVGLAVADPTFRFLTVVLVVLTVAILWLTYRLD